MSIVMKTIRMRGGGTRRQKVQILKSGKWKFLKNPKKSSSTKKKPSKLKKYVRRAKRKVAKKKRRRNNKRKIPLFAAAGFAAPFFMGSEWSGGNSVVGRLLEGNLEDAGKIAMAHFTGIDPYTHKFNFGMLWNQTITPIFIGSFMSMLASKLGFNRRLNLPFVKL